MKTSHVAALAIVAAFCLAPARAEDTAKPPRSKEAPAAETQQEKMKRCNVEAGKKELKGEERRAFMSTCLKG